MTSQIAVSGPPIRPLLEVRGLKKYFPIHKGLFSRHVGDVRAVDGVNFDIYPRETLGVVGESGCGKTTVGRTVLRLLEPTAGSAVFEGKNVFEMTGKELRAARRHMQIIFQDPYSSLNPRMTVGALIGDALELHGIARGEARLDRAKELLERVGLQSSYVNRYPHEFSGGQRQRIGIARAVALNPRFIVCDEAVSALDVSVQAQVLNLLRDLQDEYELSYMFIAHDLAVVRHIADRIAVMYLGRIVEMSTCDDLFENPLHPYTQALLSAIPVARPGRKKNRVILQGDVPNPINPPTGCHFHTRCPLAYDRCRVEAPEITPARDGHRVACHLYESVDWPATPFSILDAPQRAVRQPAPPPVEEVDEVDPDESLTGLDDLFEGSSDGDPQPVGIPEILRDVEGMRLGPFGELVDPEDSFTSTSEVPSLDAMVGRESQPAELRRPGAPGVSFLPDPGPPEGSGGPEEAATVLVMGGAAVAREEAATAAREEAATVLASKDELLAAAAKAEKAALEDDDTLRMPLPDLEEPAPTPDLQPESTGVMPPIHDDEGRPDDVSLHFGDTAPVATLEDELPTDRKRRDLGDTQPLGAPLDEETLELAPLEDGDVGDDV